MNLIENNTTEFKLILTETIEREIVAFLNSKDAGDIYIGIDDFGIVIGLQDVVKTQLQLSQRIADNIRPSTLGLFDIIVKSENNKQYIHLNVTSGMEKSYYLNKYGIVPKGCFIRVGSDVQQMNIAMIEDLFSKRTRNSLSKIVSPKRNLTFQQL